MRLIFPPFGDEFFGDEVLFKRLLQDGKPFIGLDSKKEGVASPGSKEPEAFHPQREGGRIHSVEDRTKHIQILLFDFADEGEGEVVVVLANRLSFGDIRIDRSAYTCESDLVFL
ncbi:MAG: hypothetical protein BWY50_00086 [Spirochaetes bacterium ADurb.Bin315]|nr:MAG: hypothetical protein BWY50_00086 [Spirochaetes bacterium ADurb.Bin315]